VFRGIEESDNNTATKQKLKNKAMASMADYGETYLAGFRANRPGASRRVYLYRNSAEGERVLDIASRVIDDASRSGDTARVEKALDILRSGAPRINEALTKRYGPQRLDNEATEAADVANSVRGQLMKELEAL
jgi:hypothetical protein